MPCYVSAVLDLHFVCLWGPSLLGVEPGLTPLYGLKIN